jgi:hypothetical protein
MFCYKGNLMGITKYEVPERGFGTLPKYTGISLKVVGIRDQYSKFKEELLAQIIIN